ncbi:MAG: Cys-tRNA(Pro) deacylase [Betaproteobacteria bacterium]|nr:MAG: Cys-tRNA(Pro) deacylase [Betaproteobacteria bacterium]
MKTRATEFLAKHGVTYTEHEYEYVEHGGTRVSSESLGVPEHEVVKTLVMQDEHAKPLIVLMHGDRKVSTKNLARQAGKKSIEPCKPEVAQRHTGYQVGGTSPFGTRKPLPVFMERSIAELAAIYINGGRRGFLVHVKTQDLVSLLKPSPVDVALED